MPRISSSLSSSASPASRRFERRVPGIEYGVLDTLVGHSLRRAEAATDPDFEATLGPHDVTPQRSSAQVAVAGNGGIAQSDLGQVRGIAYSRVVQVGDSPMTRGRLAREAQRIDARGI